MIYELAILSIFPLAMILAAISDLFTMTIPNKISIALVAAFIILAPIAGLDWDVIAGHAAAGTLVFLVSLGMFAMGWIGGGDAKLVSATALWLGFEQLLPYILFSAVAGGALTLLILFARTIPLPTILCRYEWISRLHNPNRGIPYGLALSAAALIVYPASSWVA